MNDLFYKGSFGIERETLRIDSNGRLAQTPHPFGEDERLTRDFCENQTEIVTPVCQSIDEAMEKLSELDTKARKILSENDESFWLYSNPPRIENDAFTEISLKGDTEKGLCFFRAYILIFRSAMII